VTHPSLPRDQRVETEWYGIIYLWSKNQATNNCVEAGQAMPSVDAGPRHWDRSRVQWNNCAQQTGRIQHLGSQPALRSTPHRWWNEAQLPLK